VTVDPVSLRDLPTAPGALLRRAARVLLFDEADRVLLARCDLPRGRMWITVGGGVDDGESDEQAARREVAEETGCGAFELGPEIARVRALMQGFHGGPLDSRQRIFVGRCDAFEPDLSGLTDEEIDQQVVVRWWTAAELVASDEHFEPDIPTLVAAYLSHGLPATPWEVTLDVR
jgi:8-oxo-dGTP pyrophosphatase MutT (NUDIX family)